MNVSSEEKILSISMQINHLVAEASLDVEDTKRAKYPAQEEYDETPLADSKASSVVRTCKGKAISLPLKFLPFSNRPLFHSSPNKSHFPHSILALSNKWRIFRQKQPMLTITYISSLKWTQNLAGSLIWQKCAFPHYSFVVQCNHKQRDGAEGLQVDIWGVTS